MYEYRVEKTTEGTTAQQAMLNKLSEDGWDLFQVFAGPGSPSIFYFRRTKASGAQQNFGR